MALISILIYVCVGAICCTLQSGGSPFTTAYSFSVSVYMADSHRLRPNMILLSYLTSSTASATLNHLCLQLCLKGTFIAFGD